MRPNRRSALRHRRAPGHTCLSALGQGGAGTPERPINQSKGCGAVMRVAPIGWLTGLPAEARFDLAARAGALTHGHPDGWASAGLLATLIGALFAGHGVSRALDQAKTVTAEALRHHGARADLLGVVARAETRARRLRHAPTQAIGEIGRGWTGEEAVAVALYAVLSARDFTDALQRAANHDGDSDSTAALAGQIWGAWKGVDSLPMAWVRRLDVLPECLHGVEALARQGHRAAPTATPDGELEPMLKTCVSILEMVHVLHRRGYQRLRIVPGMAPSGCCWRVSVTPSDNIRDDHGALLRDFDQGAHHTTGSIDRPFGWDDAQPQDPHALADRFLTRHPDLARRGQGADWAYAGWYLEVLEQARRGRFPVAYADWHGEGPDPRYLVLMGPQAPPDVRMLAPPLVIPPPEGTPSDPEASHTPPSVDEGIDWENVDLRDFDLSEAAGREAALIGFYHQWEGALLPFTAKVWDSLTDPKEVKVGQMAQVLGLGGTGKATLHAILACYLKTTDAILASIEDASDSLDFHADPKAWGEALGHWFQEADRVLTLEAARWARLLNGEPMDPVADAPPLAKVLPGPWLKRD